MLYKIFIIVVAKLKKCFTNFLKYGIIYAYRSRELNSFLVQKAQELANLEVEGKANGQNQETRDYQRVF